MLRLPHGMQGMADSSENNTPLPVVLRPAGNRCGAEVLIHKSVDVLAPQNNILGVSVARYEVLFVIHRETFDALSDRMIPAHDSYPEGSQRRRCAGSGRPAVLPGRS